MKTLLTTKLQAWKPILFCCFLVAIVGCQKQDARIKVGVMSELTGPISAFGKRAFNGIELAAQELNDQGGISGKKIQLVVEDDKSVPQQAATAMTKLTDIDKVPIVVGMVGSGLGMAAGPIANKSKIVLVACGVSTPAYSTSDDYTFRIRGSSEKELEAMAQIAFSDYSVKTLAILHVQNDFGSSYKDAFKKKFEAQGGHVAVVEAFQSGATDMRAQLAKVKESGVGAVFIAAQGAENGYVLKQSKELGLNLKFFATVGMEVPDAIKVGGDAANGVVYTTSGYDPNRDDPLVRAFNQKFKEKYGADSDLFSAEGYDALRIAAKAIAQVGSDPERIRQYLYEMKDFDGVTGKITFDRNGDPTRKSIFLKTIENGKYVTLKTDVAR